jgi:hypothetical protein
MLRVLSRMPCLVASIFRSTWGFDTASSFAYDTDASGVEAAMCFLLVPNDGSLGWPYGRTRGLKSRKEGAL